MNLEEAVTISLDLIAPLKLVKRSNKFSPWFSPALKTGKINTRKAERKWRHSRSPEDRISYKNALRGYLNDIASAKKTYLGEHIQQASTSQKEMFKIVDEFTNPHACQPVSKAFQFWVDTLATFFDDKINTIYSSFPADSSSVATDTSSTSPSYSFEAFQILKSEEVALTLKKVKSGSPNDVIPAHVLDGISPVLLSRSNRFIQQVSSMFHHSHLLEASSGKTYFRESNVKPFPAC